MYLFLKKIAILKSLFVASIFFLYFYGDYKKPVSPIKATTTILFAGDSRIQTSINDFEIKNSQNIALASEPIKYSFFKIKKVINENRGINKIYLGFSYHSISKNFDDVISINSLQMDKSPVYFSYLPFNEKIILLQNHIYVLFPYVQNVYQQSIKNLIFTRNNKALKNDFWGGYRNDYIYTAIYPPAVDNRIKGHYFQNDIELDFSDASIFYLYEIIKLCKNKNIDLVLVNTPLHPFYLRSVPTKFISKYKEIIQQLRLPFIDFNRYYFSDSMFMPDGDHVSARGAAVVTKMIQEMEQKDIR